MCLLYDDAVPLHICHQHDVNGTRDRIVALLAEKYPDIPAETSEVVAQQINKSNKKV